MLSRRLSYAKIVQTERNPACLNCWGAANFLQKYYFFTVFTLLIYTYIIQKWFLQQKLLLSLHAFQNTNYHKSFTNCLTIFVEIRVQIKRAMHKPHRHVTHIGQFVGFSPAHSSSKKMIFRLILARTLHLLFWEISVSRQYGLNHIDLQRFWHDARH